MKIQFLFNAQTFNIRQKSRASQAGIPTPAVPATVKGPDEDKIKAILERTGYTLDVTTGFLSLSLSWGNLLTRHYFRATKVRRATAKLGRSVAGQWLRGVLRQDSEGHVRRRIDSAL